MDNYETLVTQARDGDESAFNMLIDRFWSASVRWAYTILGDFDLSQDAAQDAFIIAYRQLDDLRDVRAFPSWLRRIVISQCARQTRRQTPSRPLDDEDETLRAPDDPVRTFDDQRLHEGVREAVRSLPDHERSVTELFYLDGYSQQEIAEALDLPLTTVKKRLQYARERLKSAQPLIGQVFNQLGGMDGDDEFMDLFSLMSPELDDLFASNTPLGVLRFTPIA